MRPLPARRALVGDQPRGGSERFGAQRAAVRLLPAGHTAVLGQHDRLPALLAPVGPLRGNPTPGPLARPHTEAAAAQGGDGRRRAPFCGAPPSPSRVGDSGGEAQPCPCRPRRCCLPVCCPSAVLCGSALALLGEVSGALLRGGMFPPPWCVAVGSAVPRSMAMYTENRVNSGTSRL